ncbi:hypothetical protein HOV93_35020 [Planctomycetes bacterium FF15]|uniref:Uncharacterized protein n=1 Tax=Bremerella alba TaxID=980252 RepID=A0A7V8V7D1_9BACT|nr:hypothetical protein [Bremerella alba]
MGAWAGSSKHVIILGAKVRILNRRRREVSDYPNPFLQLGGGSLPAGRTILA